MLKTLDPKLLDELTTIDASSPDVVRDKLYRYAENLRAQGFTERQTLTLVIEAAAVIRRHP